MFCRRSRIWDCGCKSSFPVRTQKKYIQTALRLYCGQKDCVMKTATTVQENAEDILAEAQQINEKRAQEEAMQVQEDDVQEDGASEQEENE